MTKRVYFNFSVSCVCSRECYTCVYLYEDKFKITEIKFNHFMCVVVVVSWIKSVKLLNLGGTSSSH